MSEENKTNALNWIPQLKSNDISINSANRIKPRLLTALRSTYMSTRKIILKEWYYTLEC